MVECNLDKFLCCPRNNVHSSSCCEYAGFGEIVFPQSGPQFDECIPHSITVLGLSDVAMAPVIDK